MEPAAGVRSSAPILRELAPSEMAEVRGLKVVGGAVPDSRLELSEQLLRDHSRCVYPRRDLVLLADARVREIEELADLVQPLLKIGVPISSVPRLGQLG